MISLDGVSSDTGILIVAPNGCETEYPAFRLLLPLLSVLAKTLEEIFHEPCIFSAGHSAWQDEAFDRYGRLSRLSGPGRVQARMLADIGRPVPGSVTLPHKLRALPLEAERSKTVQHENRPVLHVLTGFLGAGKTTIILEWLSFLRTRNHSAGVMQNEFGKVGLDALLLRGEAFVEEADEGGAFCSLADSLRPGLQRLLHNLPAGQYIWETTGLANPDHVLEALNHLTDLTVPGLLITVVDAIDLAAALEAPAPGLEQQALAGIRRAQIRAADVLVLNKADAVPETCLDAIERTLAGLNASAEILRSVKGRIPFERLDEIHARQAGARDAQSPVPPLPHGQAQTHEHEGFYSQLLEFAGPVSRVRLMEILREFMPSMYRIKDLVDISDKGATTVQYAAGRLSMEPYDLEIDQQGYLMLIGNSGGASA